MKRVIRLGDGRAVSLGGYVKAWKAALAAPAGSTFDKGFNWYPETREEILRTFRKGLADRINRRIDGFPGVLRPEVLRGRKWSHEWQIETYRAAQQLNRPRLVIHWLPAWLKARFAHRIEEEDGGMTAAELKSKREALELTQVELAEILGVRQATVSGWETGKRAIAHPIVLAMMEVERQQKGKGRK